MLQGTEICNDGLPDGKAATILLKLGKQGYNYVPSGNQVMLRAVIPLYANALHAALLNLNSRRTECPVTTFY